MFHYYEASDPLRYLEEINQRIGKVDLVIGAFVLNKRMNPKKLI